MLKRNDLLQFSDNGHTHNTEKLSFLHTIVTNLNIYRTKLNCFQLHVNEKAMKCQRHRKVLTMTD